MKRRTQPRDGFWLHLAAFYEILIFALFFVTFIAQPFRIPSESMEPTMNVGDFLLGDKQAFAAAGVLDRVLPPSRIRRGDLVIFRYPVDPTRDLVKRVIGLPGDRVHLRDGVVYLNGVAQREVYAVYAPGPRDAFRDDFPSLHRVDSNADPAWWAELRRTVVEHEITVPADSYFVLGDNRNESEDSRYWGFVPREAIVARPLIVYFSMAAPPPGESLFGRLKSGVHAMRVLR